MIEILFGESEAGSMKFAKQQSLENNDSKHKELSGSPDEVICLALMLDIGNIAEPIDSQDRQDLIFSMYTQNGWDDHPEVLEELKETGKLYANEFDKLIRFLKTGEAIRIWYSDSPYSLCGLYFLCHQLRTYTNDMFVVKLPDYRQTSDNMITIYSNWGEVPDDEFSSFLCHEHKLTPIEKQTLGDNWSELIVENSPLRAIVNGTLISVDETFYDFLILKHLSLTPIKESRFIGDILGHYPIGIGDWWYASRIEKMIAKGLIKITEDSKHKYARTICLA